MRVRTVRDLGAAVREARQRLELTQADLASLLGVNRRWVGRLEKGHARLEAQLVLDAAEAVGLSLHVDPQPEDSTTREFDDVLADLRRELARPPRTQRSTVPDLPHPGYNTDA
jgi:HTH-type transcriptional regulator/antitoxin HipB